MLVKEEDILGEIRNNFKGHLPFYVGEDVQTGEPKVVNFEYETSAFVYGKSGGSKTSIVRNFLYGIKDFVSYKDVNVYIYDKDGVNGYEKEFGDMEQVVRHETSLEGFIKMVKKLNRDRKLIQKYIQEAEYEEVLEYKNEEIKSIDVIPYNVLIIEGIDGLYEDLKENMFEKDYKNVIEDINQIITMGRSAGIKMIMTASSVKEYLSIKTLLANASLKYINSEIDEEDLYKLVGNIADEYKGLLRRGIEKGLVKRGYMGNIKEVKLNVVG